MTNQEIMEQAALDQAWMEAESRREVFERLAGETDDVLAHLIGTLPGVAEVVRKACAIVGLECEKRIRERPEA